MFKLSIHQFIHKLTAALLVLAFAFSTAGINVAQAADFTVTNLNDSGPGSLRQAILDAKTSPGADTVTFDISGTITVASTLPAISDSAGLTIDGSGQTVTVSGNDEVQVMIVNSGAVLAVQNLTIANGRGTSSPAVAGGIYNQGGTLTVTGSTFSGNQVSDSGGAIFNREGTLTITGSTFSGNHATTGGSIYNRSGTVTITGSTFSGNYASTGGGIFNSSNISGSGSVTVINSTFSGNSGNINNIGGAIGNSADSTLSVANSTFSGNSAFLGAGIFNQGTLNVTNSTFSGNSASFGGGIRGNGTMRNTIFANNSGGNCVGTFVDGGGNLVWGDTTCPGIHADPKLLPLANNGGPTQTMALDIGSAAIDVAVLANCPAADQRGVTRPQGAGCDIGAFELEPASDITVPTILLTSPAEGAVYLLGQAVNVEYACQDEDGGSGLASCFGTVANGSTIDTSSLGAKSFTINAVDNAGNTASLTHHYSVVDATAPTITIAAPAEGATYLLGQSVNAVYACQDEVGGLGLASCVGTVANGSPIDTSSLGAKSFTVNTADNAGNPASLTYNYSVVYIDTTPPAITITTPAEGAVYLLGQAVNADYTCQDEEGGSGLASCVGPTVSGSPIDTSSVGSKSFTVNASDNAGNPASVTHNYSVVYNFSGFFQPVDNLPTLNMVKGGAGVAVRFSLGGNQGLNILAAGYPISQQVACEGGLPVDDIEQTVAAGNSSLSYDAATNTYSYTWKTDKAWAVTCRQLIVRLSDGTEHVANFKFK